MFGFSFGELLIVGIVALVVFGPEKLPELARTIGEFTSHFRKGADSLRREFYNSVYKPIDEATGAVKKELRVSSLPTPKHLLNDLLKEPTAERDPPAEKPPHE